MRIVTHTGMTTTTTIFADDGKSICRKDECGPNNILSAVMGEGDDPSNWKDCEFGLQR